MKGEAARGIVGFSSFLSEKVAEIKRDSVNEIARKMLSSKSFVVRKTAHVIATIW